MIEKDVHIMTAADSALSHSQGEAAFAYYNLLPMPGTPIPKEAIGRAIFDTKSDSVRIIVKRRLCESTKGKPAVFEYALFRIESGAAGPFLIANWFERKEEGMTLSTRMQVLVRGYIKLDSRAKWLASIVCLAWFLVASFMFGPLSVMSLVEKNWMYYLAGVIFLGIPAWFWTYLLVRPGWIAPMEERKGWRRHLPRWKKAGE